MRRKNKMGIKDDLEIFKIEKDEWNKTLSVNKKKILKVFLAGAIVSTLIWWLIFYIYTQTGFIGIQ
jgi:hypothetical protein